MCLGKSIMSVMSILINYLMKLFSFVDSRFNTTLYHCHNINNSYGKTLILHKNVSRKKWLIFRNITVNVINVKYILADVAHGALW